LTSEAAVSRLYKWLSLGCHSAVRGCQLAVKWVRGALNVDRRPRFHDFTRRAHAARAPQLAKQCEVAQQARESLA
jgi:hypothetical protein